MRKVIIPHKPEVEGSSPSLDTIYITSIFYSYTTFYSVSFNYQFKKWIYSLSSHTSRFRTAIMTIPDLYHTIFDMPIQLYNNFL